ncbi:MAG: TetR/AcrR family transcriptional regulator [Candidatus Cryptobacteroides sp.]
MRHKEGTDDKILKAAETEFFTKGYDGARTTSIAENAGVTHAMLHYYFRTKEQLFGEVLKRNIDNMFKVMFSVFVQDERPFSERLAEGVGRHFDVLAANPLLPRFILNEILPNAEKYFLDDHGLKSNINEVYRNAQKSIDKEAASGRIERVDARKLFFSIVALNLFPFVSFEFYSGITDEKDKERFLAERRAENIETMKRRILKINKI